MEMTGESGSSEIDYREIFTNTEFHNSVIFHLIKKVVAFVLCMHQQIPSLLLRCTSQKPEVDTLDFSSQPSSSIGLKDSISHDFIWFKCCHVVKRLAFKTPTGE